MKGQTKEEILAFINNWGGETLAKAMEIKFIDVDLENETLTATMPVLPRTHQPFGIMHGGASCVLAETLGSSLSNIFIDGEKYSCNQHQLQSPEKQKRRDRNRHCPLHQKRKNDACFRN